MEQITDYKAWLNEPPAKEDIRFLDAEETISYIPIARIENLLDNFDSWSADFFAFNVYRTANYWFASGHVLLTVEYWQDGKHYVIKKPGARTRRISSTDLNMDYEATILSDCISNASKKLGKKFGREFNGRLEKGETALIDAPLVDEAEESAEDKRIKKLIDGATTISELAGYKKAKNVPKHLTSYFMDKMNKLSKS